MKNNERAEQISKAIKELDKVRAHLDLEEEYELVQKLNELIFTLSHYSKPTNVPYPPAKEK